jgi:divalent metal cation (Fe/Co/Zn/Cd) transporter
MLDKNDTIENGHNIATAIEKMILENYGIESTIHVEPSE